MAAEGNSGRRFGVWAPWALLVIAVGGLNSSGCSIIDAFGEDASIDYPASGFHGLNLLDPVLTDATLRESMSFRAELGKAASLRLEVRNSDTIYIGVFSPAGTGWSVDVGSNEGGTTSFVALEGFGIHDMKVNPDACTDAEGELRIDYYENGDLEPSFTKAVFIDLP